QFGWKAWPVLPGALTADLPPLCDDELPPADAAHSAERRPFQPNAGRCSNTLDSFVLRRFDAASALRARLVVGYEYSQPVCDRALQTRFECARCFYPRRQVRTQQYSTFPSLCVPHRCCPYVPVRVRRAHPEVAPVLS